MHPHPCLSPPFPSALLSEKFETPRIRRCTPTKQSNHVGNSKWKAQYVRGPVRTKCACSDNSHEYETITRALRTVCFFSPPTPAASHFRPLIRMSNTAGSGGEALNFENFKANIYRWCRQKYDSEQNITRIRSPTGSARRPKRVFIDLAVFLLLKIFPKNV